MFFSKSPVCAGNTTGESISGEQAMRELVANVTKLVKQGDLLRGDVGELRGGVDELRGGVYELRGGVDELRGEFQQQAKTFQQQSQLMQVLLLSQFQPAASTASTNNSDTYRKRALDHYDLAGDQGQAYCMVTGDQVATAELTAGHIYRQAWPAPILVSLLNPTIAPCMLWAAMYHTRFFQLPTAWSYCLRFAPCVGSTACVRCTAANS
jgi:hypothetical protein